MRILEILLFSLVLILSPACSTLIDPGERPPGDGGSDGTDDGADDGADGSGDQGGDIVPPDEDGDGILDNWDSMGDPGDDPCVGGNDSNCDDNCPTVPNADQADEDNDGVGDACESTIYNIQTGAFLPGTEVFIENVLISTYMVPFDGNSTQPDTYWVQEDPPGPYRGIRILDSNMESGVLSGWLVSIGGLYYEDSEGNAYIEVNYFDPIDFEPDQHVQATPVTMNDLATNGEVWEGVVVSVGTAYPLASTEGLTDFSVSSTSGGQAELLVGVLFQDFFDINHNADDPINDLVGVVEERSGTFVINPRSCSDFVIGENDICSCPPAEHSVSQMQDRDHIIRLYQGCDVQIDTNLFVSGVWDGGLYVQQGITGAIHAGIRVSMESTGGFFVGQQVTLAGTYVESQGESDVIEPRVAEESTEQTELIPLGVEMADIVGGPAQVEEYEGCLVTVSQVKLDSRAFVEPDDTDRGAFTILPISGGDALHLVVGWRFRHSFACPEENDIGCNYETEDQRANVPPNKEFNSITGIFSYDHGRYMLMPRDCQDITDSSGQPACIDD